MIGPNTCFIRIPQYNGLRREGHHNRRDHCGVMLLIRESTPNQEIELQTDVQVVAARVNMGRCITVASVYISRAHNFTYDNLANLINQLPQPILLLGDFNSYHEMWGSNETDNRGRIIERIIADFQLNVMNNGAPTRIYGGAERAVDLSICSPVLQLTVQWTVSETPRDSDHRPILLTEAGRAIQRGTKQRNYRNITWDTFKSSKHWTDMPEEKTMTASEIIDDFYTRLTGAINDSTDEYTVKPFFPKPWWSAELTASLKKREQAYKAYRRRKSPQNFIRWKRCRAEHRKSIAEHKKGSWREMANKMNSSTPLGKVWRAVNK